jgi:glycosyltransferase involved in cell wall biosynthesis
MNHRFPLISVCLITYNHENYISEAIEGALKQKTNFNFEIVIGEDCSKDKTSEIVLAYQKKYPEIIKLFSQKTNIGAMRNAYEYTLPNCEGKYIAFLEGDDYWTDPLKLQKQVDFLENHVEYSMCFHNSFILLNNKIQKSKYANLDTDRDITINELLKSNMIPTASCMFKNKFDANFYNKVLNLKLASDWFLHIYNGERGKIRYMNETMSLYRSHDQGLWSSLNLDETIRFRISTILEINKALDYKYEEEFKNTLVEYALKLKNMVGKKEIKAYLINKLLKRKV